MDREGLSWQRRRSLLCHDWLKHRFLPSLGAFLQVVEGRVDSAVSLECLRDEILREWEANAESFGDLADRFEVDLSPRRLFEAAPLDRCDPETRKWLEQVVHHSWMVRFGVLELIHESHRVASEAKEAFAAFRDAAASIVIGEDAVGGALSKALREFYVRCERLGEVLSRYPVEVAS